MKAKARIDFACNDPDNGLFAGSVWQAAYRINKNDDARLEYKNWDGIRFTETTRGFRIHRRIFRCLDAQDWIGNWCWNGYWLERNEAKRLLDTMRKNGWKCVEGPESFFNWFNSATTQEEPQS